MKLPIIAGAVALICATPAFADTANNVTLVIENDAGMVTQLPDLTQRECDAVALLLAPRKVAAGQMIFYGTTSIYSAGIIPSKQASSKLTVSRCLVPADK